MQRFITFQNIDELAKCDDKFTTHKMYKALKALARAKDYDWLSDDSHDYAVARVLANFVFNNEIKDDETAKQESLRALKKKGWGNTDFAKEWRDHMITTEQVRNAFVDYLCSDDVVDIIFDAVQCTFRKGDDRPGVRGRFNQWDNEHDLWCFDHDLMCMIAGLNDTNNLFECDPWSTQFRGGGAPREYIIRSGFKDLRTYIKQLQKLRDEKPEEIKRLCKVLEGKWKE